MFRARRLFLALVMIFTPFVAPLYVGSYGLSDAGLDALPFIGVLVLGSLVVVLAAAFIAGAAADQAAVRRLMNIAYANLVFLFFDVAIFAFLVYGRRFSMHRCEFGPICELYPVMWLALAGMHSCYVALGFFFKFRLGLRAAR